MLVFMAVNAAGNKIEAQPSVESLRFQPSLSVASWLHGIPRDHHLLETSHKPFPYSLGHNTLW